MILVTVQVQWWPILGYSSIVSLPNSENLYLKFFFPVVFVAVQVQRTGQYQGYPSIVSLPSSENLLNSLFGMKVHAFYEV